MTTLGPIVHLSLDIDTSGPRLSKHAIVEIGAVAYDIVKKEVLDRFSVMVNIPEDRTWEPKCLVEYWNNRDWESMDDSDPDKQSKKEQSLHLQEKKKTIDNNQGLSAKLAMEALDIFIMKAFKTFAQGDLTRFCFMTDSAFDILWIDTYLDAYLDHNPLYLYFDGKYKPVINKDDVARGISHLTDLDIFKIESKAWFSADAACRKFLSIPLNVYPDIKHDHVSVHDAEYNVKEHQIHMDWLNRYI